MARRDRGLTAAEQDSYLQWLTDDRAHAPAILQLEKIWSGLGVVRGWPEVASVDDASPQDDAAAKRVRRRRWILQSAALTAGGIAAIAIVLALAR